SEGLIALTACQSGILGKFILGDNLSFAEMWLKKLSEAFSDDLYIELMPNRMKEQVKLNKVLLELSNKFKIKTVITTDAHYCNKSDEKFHRAVKAISWRKKYSESGFSDDTFYLLKSDEVKSLIDEHHPDVTPLISLSFDNSLEVMNKCNFKIEFKASDTLPELYDNPSVKLRELAYEGLEKFTPYKLTDVEAKARLELELDRIIKKNYANYFLIVHDYVKWCKDNNILVGPGRGSIGSSLVAFSLNITEVDPLKFNLLFDRFISEIRKDYPDADLDFEDSKRKLLLNYLKDKYHEENFSKIITYSTWHAKGALRDAGRIFNVPIAEINKISNLVVTRSGGDARADFCTEDTFEEFEQAKEFRKKYPEMVNIAIGLEGRIRHRGTHAAGVILTKKPISTYVPIERISNEICTAYEKKEMESAHLIKFDILGLKTLTVINETLNLISPRPKLPAEFEDPKVYETVFKTGNTLGIFQAETTGMSKLVKQLKVDNFKLLTYASVLYRPGPLHSGQTATFVLRHHKKEKWKYDHPLLEPITKETYGLILTQEQVMQIMFDLGNFSWATAESARKVMTKSQGKAIFNKMRQEFIENAFSKHNLPKAEGGKIFDVVSTFGCLTGDTKIYRASSNQYKNSTLTIDEAFDYQKSDNFKHRKLKILSMCADGRIRPNKIKRVHKTGLKEVFYIRTDSNKTIRASKNHRFLINGKWCKVSDIKPGDYIQVTDLKLSRKIYGIGLGSGPFGKASPRFKKGLGYTNEIKIMRKYLKKKYNNSC
ncbi:hypothetical protein LCGC14_1959790, partial [marine sediment metagenome]